MTIEVDLMMEEPDYSLPLNARSLQFRWRSARHNVTYDERYLIYTRTKVGLSKTFKTPLWQLDEEFVVDDPPDPSAQYHCRPARYALALAAILHFSEVPRFIPYLIPALLLFSLVKFCRGFPLVWRCLQTRVMKEDGEEIVAIPHLPKLELTRQRFEESLRDAIKRTKDIPTD